MHRQTISDEAFMAWAESYKSCKYCHRRFFGPVCGCELPLSSYAKDFAAKPKSR